jgi:uncharacterized membrane protein YbhN (UPF0104 family)
MNRNVIGRLQWVFVPLVAFFAWISLKDDWNSIALSLTFMSLSKTVLATFAVLLGLSCTGLVWSILLSSLGFRIPSISAQPIFFIGQLGKYIPGSVWALGAQAKMAKKWNIPTRATVTTGILFLYLNLVSAGLLGLLAANDIWQTTDINKYLLAVIFVLGATFLTPQGIEFFGRRMAGNSAEMNLSAKDYVKILILMSLTWTLYGTAIFVLGNSLVQNENLTLMYSISIFAVAYVSGVLVIFSPAGVGVREGILILALTPKLGFEQAAGISLLIRAIHTISDFSLAGFWYLFSKFRLQINE